MPRWLSITLVVVVLLIVGIGGAYWWYLGDGSPPANLPAYSFDIAAVRAKADELPGGKASDMVPAGNGYTAPDTNHEITNSNNQCPNEEYTLEQAYEMSCNTTFAKLCVEELTA